MDYSVKSEMHDGLISRNIMVLCVRTKVGLLLGWAVGLLLGWAVDFR